MGFKYCTPAVKPKLTEEHKKNRLGWAKFYINWSNGQWRQVVWYNESRFRDCGNDGTPLVLRKQDKKYENCCHILCLVKFGGGSLVVWWFGLVFGLGVLDLWSLLTEI